jgi:hopanoid biosynthesis associated RND transporter like protein HpnN
VLNLSLLPALLKVFPPASQPIDMGFAWARPIDDFLLRRRWLVLGTWILLGTIGAVAAMNLRFDFNPLHLKDPKVESVSSILDLMQDPLRTPYNIEILAPDIDAAQAMAEKIGQLPEVEMVLTAGSFVPKDQEAKLAIIQDLGDLVGLSLDPMDVAAPPTPDEVRASLRKCAAMLREAVPSSDVAQQLARLLDQAAESDDAFLKRLDHVLLSTLKPRLEALKAALTAKPITVDTLPPEIRKIWIAPDGQARVLVIPAGNSNDNAVLERFITAVRTVAPDASGSAVQIYEAGRAVSHAFEIATLFALASMAILLGLILRRAIDVLMVLVPLAAAALATALFCWLIGLQLNFANIIALPLLLGIGVAFNIYFVVNWRNGISGPLQTSTARGVLFSGLTTGASFASLAVSGHLGTASMGIVLLTGMAMTLVSIFTLIPALLGPPPKSAGVQVT